MNVQNPWKSLISNLNNILDLLQNKTVIQIFMSIIILFKIDFRYVCILNISYNQE